MGARGSRSIESDDDSEYSTSEESTASESGDERAGSCCQSWNHCWNDLGSFRRKNEIKGRGPSLKAFNVENSGKDVSEYFTLNREKVLGEGGFAIVCRAVEKRTSHERAVKCILKSRVPNAERLQHEIRTMLAMDHPNIIKLFQSFEDHKQIYLVMELCAGGELFDVVVEQGRLSEADTAVIMQQMLRALVYMHESGICHRDMKPENFLFLRKAPVKSNVLKVVDFGIAGHFEVGHASFSTKVGTPYYVAPEVLARWGRYDEKCDCWSAGVILYVLLSGILPIKGRNTQDTLRKVVAGEYRFPPAIFDSVSADAKDLIKNLLEISTSDRLSAKEALQHTWIANTAPQRSAPLSQDVISNLQAFRHEHRLKKAALHILARHQDNQILDQLRDIFLHLDDDGDGIITAAELQKGLSAAGVTPMANQDVKELMRAVDADGDGQIDYTEFLAASVQRQSVVRESECWAAFRVFDKNDDGRISQKELADVLNSQEVNNAISKAQLAKILKEVDSNGDGYIDFDEFMAMMQS
eukprot:TRINITY_DN60079_c0_g1_i1.p1 TRINITY_DN60079_c0_g1~~TRINITY_DN60079_c0_g1_i1.p1  ORF type:complete len:549 (-),score=123.86 TRINITY_DN60079_c0_g1_i1:123-1700(-)